MSTYQQKVGEHEWQFRRQSERCSPAILWSELAEGLRTFRVRSRRYRNRRIGEFLKELHLTEGRNTGFKKILEALEKNGSPLPEFETDETYDYFITRLFVREGFYGYQEAKVEDTTKETPEKPQRNPQKTPKKPQRNPQEILMELIRENPSVTVKELVNLTGLTNDSVRYYMDKMRKEGTLAREGSTKAGQWIVLR